MNRAHPERAAMAQALSTAANTQAQRLLATAPGNAIQPGALHLTNADVIADEPKAPDKSTPLPPWPAIDWQFRDKTPEQVATTETAAGEADPFGRPQHQPGAKLDAGKPRAGLVLGDFARALLAVAEVGTYGARKYSDSGWRQVPDGVVRYTDAMARHWLAEQSGEPVDAASGLRHSAQVAWNALARLELQLRAAEDAGTTT